MGAYWLQDQLKEKGRVVEVSVHDNTRIEVRVAGELGTATINGYLPTPQEYLVGNEVVDRAKELGANWLIAEPWCHLSVAARGYGKRIGVRVVDVGQFMKLIEAGHVS